MRVWMLTTLLGVISLGTGGVLLLQEHHTLSLGGLGLGILLILVGVALRFNESGRAQTEAVRPTVPPKNIPQSRRWAKTLAAVLVVVAVGIGTFYATTLIASQQPAGTTTTSERTFTSQTFTSGPSTFSTSKSTSVVRSTFTQTIGVSSSTTSTSGSLTTYSTASTASSSTSTEPFELLGSPSVFVQGNEATLNAQYSNRGTSAQVNLQVSVYLANGNLLGTGEVFTTGQTVSPGGNFSVNYMIGSFPGGSYTVTFFVVGQVSGGPLSSSTTLIFNV